ncbi:MAG: glycosyltransferase family 2 protein [Nitrospiraceae bacterium]|nr:glycosyltransferase family 2 protein [Nitrospiraceae bacterium]
MATQRCSIETQHSDFAPSLSVIIPAFNEAERLPSTLQRIVDYLDRRRTSYEIIVVDDGSKDGTSQLVAALTRENRRIRLISSASNMGKGAAVRRGMDAAKGDFRLFADADGATPIEELARLEAAINAGADLAIGSRALASRDHAYTVRAGRYRSTLGSLFNLVVQRLGVTGLSDTQCGFKLFRRAIAQDLFSVSCVDGYAFDLELLYIAQQRRYRIAEIPVNWADQPGSKVRPWRDGMLMLREFVHVRRRDAQGHYGARYQAPADLLNPSLSAAEPSQP